MLYIQYIQISSVDFEQKTALLFSRLGSVLYSSLVMIVSPKVCMCFRFLVSGWKLHPFLRLAAFVGPAKGPLAVLHGLQQEGASIPALEESTRMRKTRRHGNHRTINCSIIPNRLHNEASSNPKNHIMGPVTFGAHGGFHMVAQHSNQRHPCDIGLGLKNKRST